MAVHQDILNRVHSHGKGARIYTPRDFLDLGTRAAVDKALSRLVKAGDLRRVGRGLYDWPRQSAALDRAAAPSADAVVDALRRHFNVAIVPANLAAANAFGLTHAVPTQPDYVASRKLGDVQVGGRRYRFTAAGAMLAPWLDSPAAPLVQALAWMRDRKLTTDSQALAKLRTGASPDAKKALARGLNRLPGWAIPLARDVVGNHAS